MTIAAWIQDHVAPRIHWGLCLWFALSEGLRRAIRPSLPPAESTSPRVLFVTTYAGTLQAFLIPHMRMLLHRGWRVEVAARFDKGSESAQLIEAEFPVHHIPFCSRAFAPRNLLALWRLRRLIQTRRYDVIHVHTPIAAMVGRAAARMSRPRPVVLYTAHGFHFYRGASWRQWILSYPAERLAARWTDGLIVMNEEDLHYGMKMGFTQGENLFRVHGVGVDLSFYGGATADDGHTVRREFGLASDDILVSCIAGIRPGKNHELLLDAWQRLADSQVNAHLLLVGGFGASSHSVKRRLDMGRNLRIHLGGFRRDIPSVLQATDVLVLASQREGLPRCIMEAMAAAKPVVATSARGNRDLIDHGCNGLLVVPEDSAGLAEALATLIRDPGLRIKMGKRGREKIEEYSLDRVLDEMGLIYDRFRRIRRR
ncbi:glycosyltransferase family 4 protein [Candidatus Bipolaricaulota bacterium]